MERRFASPTTASAGARASGSLPLLSRTGSATQLAATADAGGGASVASAASAYGGSASTWSGGSGALPALGVAGAAGPERGSTPTRKASSVPRGAGVAGGGAPSAHRQSVQSMHGASASASRPGSFALQQQQQQQLQQQLALHQQTATPGVLVHGGGLADNPLDLLGPEGPAAATLVPSTADVRAPPAPHPMQQQFQQMQLQQFQQQQPGATASALSAALASVSSANAATMASVLGLAQDGGAQGSAGPPPGSTDARIASLYETYGIETKSAQAAPAPPSPRHAEHVQEYAKPKPVPEFELPCVFREADSDALGAHEIRRGSAPLLVELGPEWRVEVPPTPAESATLAMVSQRSPARGASGLAGLADENTQPDELVALTNVEERSSALIAHRYPTIKPRQLDMVVEDVETLELVLQSPHPQTFTSSCRSLCVFCRSDVMRVRDVRDRGIVQILVRQLFSPYDQSQSVAARVLRGMAALVDNRDHLLKTDALRALCGVVQNGGAGMGNAVWCMLLLLCSSTTLDTAPGGAANPRDGPSLDPPGLHDGGASPMLSPVGNAVSSFGGAGGMTATGGWPAVHRLQQMQAHLDWIGVPCVPALVRVVGALGRVAPEETLVLTAYMLGYLCSSDSARASIVQQGGGEALSLLANTTDCLELRKLIVWATQRLRLGVFEFHLASGSTSAQVGAEPLGAVVGLTVLLSYPSVEVQRFAAIELQRALMSENASRQFIQGEGVAALLVACRAGHLPLQQWTLMRLAEHAHDELVCHEIRRLGGVALACELLRSRDAMVAQHATLLLANMTDHSTTVQRDVHEARVYDRLVALLRSANPVTVQYAAAVLANVSTLYEARQVIFQSGALPILLQHMRHVDPDVQVVSLRSVAMLSHDEVCANELCKIDVVSTMAHLSVSPHLGVQHMTAVVAANCIRGDTARQQLLRSSLLHGLIRQLGSHVPALQAAACVAIANSANQSSEVQREVARLAGLHQLHVLLQSESQNVASSALFCIGILACNDDNRRELRRLGSLRRIVALLPGPGPADVLQADPRLVVALLEAMSLFCQNDPPSQRDVCRLGAVERIAQLVSCDNYEIGAAASVALSCIAVDDESQQIVAQQKALEGIAVLLCRPSLKMRTAALRALAVWSQNRRTAEMYTRLGVLPMLVQMLDAGEPAVTELMLLVLGNSVCVLHDLAKSSIMQSDAVNNIVACLDATDTSVIELTSWLLLLCSDAAYADAMAVSGVVRGLCKVLGSTDLAATRFAVTTLAQVLLNSDSAVCMVREQQLLPRIVPLLKYSEEPHENTHSDLEVLRYALMAIAASVQQPIDEAVLRHSGALPLLVQCLRFDVSERADVVEWAVTAVARSVQSDPVNRNELRKLNCLKLAIDLLSTGNDAIQVQAILVVNRLNK